MTGDDTAAGPAYWSYACHFFRKTKLQRSVGSYFFHYKSLGIVKIGVMPQASVNLGGDPQTLVAPSEGTLTPLVPDESVFTRIGRSLDRNVPSFFLVSPDFRRRYRDPELPTIAFVQPGLEFTFSAECPGGEVSYACDDDHRQRGEAMLSGIPSAGELHASLPRTTIAPFSDLAAGWIPAEDDDAFLGRLEDAIAVLQDYPEGKMTLTRAYHYRGFETRDLFQLYEIYASTNGEYASSHFCCLDAGVFSIGCSPENKFEFVGDRLIVDVVAATCRASTSDAFLARELVANPKQIKEHRLSLDRPMRFSKFCLPDSIRMASEMGVKHLRNVCHLHSIGHGQLLPGVGLFDLLSSIEFPVLGARPRELVPLADTETEPHRYYGGLVGHSHGTLGGAFLNIRNVLVTRDLIRAKVGVGLLAESVPTSELWETRNKISGVMEAVHRWQAAASGQAIG